MPSTTNYSACTHGGTPCIKILTDGTKASTEPAHTQSGARKPTDWEEFTAPFRQKCQSETNWFTSGFSNSSTNGTFGGTSGFGGFGGTRGASGTFGGSRGSSGFGGFNPFTNQSTNGTQSSDERFKFFNRHNASQTIQYPQHASVIERDIIDQINIYLQATFMDPNERKLRGRSLLKLVHPDKCRSTRLNAHTLTQIVLKHMKSA